MGQLKKAKRYATAAEQKEDVGGLCRTMAKVWLYSAADKDAQALGYERASPGEWMQKAYWIPQIVRDALRTALNGSMLDGFSQLQEAAIGIWKQRRYVHLFFPLGMGVITKALQDRCNHDEVIK